MSLAGLSQKGYWKFEIGINPHLPPSGLTQWLFQGPPAESKVLQRFASCGGHYVCPLLYLQQPPASHR